MKAAAAGDASRRAGIVWTTLASVKEGGKRLTISLETTFIVGFGARISGSPLVGLTAP
jgi:hypothetical protein